MYQKYANAIPLYRQESDWKQIGVSLSRATLANWVITCARDYFRPLYDYLHRELLKRQFLMADETRVQVLKEKDRNPQTDSFMRLFRNGEDGLPDIILYHYTETRAKFNAAAFLEGFHGYLETDGYQGYNNLPGVTRCCCYAHLRRYFAEAIPSGKQLDTLTPRKGTRLAKAVNYAQNQKPYFMNYLDDGRCSFSNNRSENAIRPFTVGRKNWLFSDTPKGADASALVYIMVEMARAHDLNIYKYLNFLLERLPGTPMSDDALSKLVPWNEEVKVQCFGPIE